MLIAYRERDGDHHHMICRKKFRHRLTGAVEARIIIVFGDIYIRRHGARV